MTILSRLFSSYFHSTSEWKGWAHIHPINISCFWVYFWPVYFWMNRSIYMGIRAFQQEHVKMKSELYIFFSPLLFSAFIFLTLVHNDTYWHHCLFKWRAVKEMRLIFEANGPWDCTSCLWFSHLYLMKTLQVWWPDSRSSRSRNVSHNLV